MRAPAGEGATAEGRIPAAADSAAAVSSAAAALAPDKDAMASDDTEAREGVGATVGADGVPVWVDDALRAAGCDWRGAPDLGPM